MAAPIGRACLRCSPRNNRLMTETASSVLAVSVRDSGLTCQTFVRSASTICQVGAGVMDMRLSAGLVVEGGVADRRTNAAHLHG